MSISHQNNVAREELKNHGLYTGGGVNTGYLHIVALEHQLETESKQWQTWQNQDNILPLHVLGNMIISLHMLSFLATETQQNFKIHSRIYEHHHS